MSELPFRTDLDQLKRQAKDLLRAARLGDTEACQRLSSAGAPTTLAGAQLAIARLHGFPSWAKLKAEAERKEAAKAEAGWSQSAVFGSWFDEESFTDRQTEFHRGSCRECGATYEFETNIVRGFADHLEAYCPRCSASLGRFREDVGGAIAVRLVEDES